MALNGLFVRTDIFRKKGIVETSNDGMSKNIDNTVATILISSSINSHKYDLPINSTDMTQLGRLNTNICTYAIGLMLLTQKLSEGIFLAITLMIRITITEYKIRL